MDYLRKRGKYDINIEMNDFKKLNIVNKVETNYTPKIVSSGAIKNVSDFSDMIKSVLRVDDVIDSVGQKESMTFFYLDENQNPLAYETYFSNNIINTDSISVDKIKSVALDIKAKTMLIARSYLDCNSENLNVPLTNEINFIEEIRKNMEIETIGIKDYFAFNSNSFVNISETKNYEDIKDLREGNSSYLGILESNK
jgi:hypothetical protein